ncbi:MAG TPA: squalene/phytoene synthase family protein [Galbitalea sp.]|jgi:phytoene/squalene synthetase|nr:squalene/phytoene synthase family protein [Galbitalea sp.]
MSRTAGSRTTLYDRVAEEAASVVIRRYSTSFGVASRLLEPAVRQHVENIYALVRLADEIVDGEATAAGLSVVDATRQLGDLENATSFAIDKGYSSNLVVHAFGLTARATGFGRNLTTPFFDSMRSDLSETSHDQESFDRYVYGSAEVIGLMCLRTFLAGEEVTDQERAELETGARALGAAFQKVNFLRDLGTDFRDLGRSYFPGISVESFNEADKVRLLADIDADLRASAAVIPRLPAGSRRAVALAQSLFTELAARLRATPADRLVATRIRVPNAVKGRLAAMAALGRVPKP